MDKGLPNENNIKAGIKILIPDKVKSKSNYMRQNRILCNVKSPIHNEDTTIRTFVNTVHKVTQQKPI